MEEINYHGDKIYQFKTGDLVYHLRAEEYFIILSEPYYPSSDNIIESGLIRRDVLRLKSMETSHMGSMGFNACKLCAESDEKITLENSTTLRTRTR